MVLMVPAAKPAATIAATSTTDTRSTLDRETGCLVERPASVCGQRGGCSPSPCCGGWAGWTGACGATGATGAVGATWPIDGKLLGRPRPDGDAPSVASALAWPAWPRASASAWAGSC